MLTSSILLFSQPLSNPAVELWEVKGQALIKSEAGPGKKKGVEPWTLLGMMEEEALVPQGGWQ